MTSVSRRKQLGKKKKGKNKDTNYEARKVAFWQERARERARLLCGLRERQQPDSDDSEDEEEQDGDEATSTPNMLEIAYDAELILRDVEQEGRYHC